MGDFNAKVGRDWKRWWGVIGKHGYGEENERGERLLNCCLNNGHEIVNTVFYQRKAKRKWTWESQMERQKHDRFHHSYTIKDYVMLCYVIVNIRSNIHRTRLVMAGIRTKMKRTQKEMMNKRSWIEVLKEDAIGDRFKTQLCNRWKQAKRRDLRTVEKR